MPARLCYQLRQPRLQNDPEETHTDGRGELHPRRESSCNALLACSQQDSPHRPFQPAKPTASQRILLKRAKATRSVSTRSHHQMASQSNRRSPRSGPKYQAPDPGTAADPALPCGPQAYPAPVQFLMTAHLLQGLHDAQKMQFKCSGIMAPSLFPALSCTFLINPHIQPEGSQHHPRPDLCCLSNSYVYLSPTQSCLLK